MAGYGLGFGSFTRSRQFAAFGQNVPVAALQPSAAWDGTAGSGFAGAPPSDPVRTTAKPVCRLLDPPNRYFTDELVIGVWAGANYNGSLLDNLGIERVIAHCEGSSFEITAPTFLLREDAQGTLRRYLGWWVVLQHPGQHGHAQVYFEAVPKDPTMQHRVIGPYQYSPQASLHDLALEVAATPAEVPGQRYRTLAGALAFVAAQQPQNALITITEGGDYAMQSGGPGYAGGNGYTTITASQPVVFRSSAGPLDTQLFRTGVDGLWFKGANITFDFKNLSYIYHENAQNRDHVFEGVNFINSGGRYQLYRGGMWPTLYIARNSPYFLECTISSIPQPCRNARLVRGCTMFDGYEDMATASECMVYNTAYDWSSRAWRDQIDALSVQYVGAGATATLEMSGNNGTNNRILTAKVDGAIVGTFSAQNTDAAFTQNTHYTVQNVVDWLNGLAGWTATFLDGSRRAVTLSRRGNVPVGAAFPPLDAKTSPLTLVTALDLHGDIWQVQFGGNREENLICVGNRAYNHSTQAVFFGPQGGTTMRDAVIANNAFEFDESDDEFGVVFSQLFGPQSHVVVAHNSWSNQPLFLRTDTNYDPDAYCLIANNVAPQINWGGTANSALVLTNNHLFTGASIPGGAAGTVVGGTRETLLRDPANGDFTPEGELLSNPKPPVLRFDMAGLARGIPAATGALAGGEEVAPAITSSNPSGTYSEGAPVGGVLTANKPVVWSVTGPDAAFVQLDTNLGDWQLEQTDFETKASYAFTFVATDQAGDTAEQIVAIAISDLDEIAPLLTAASGIADGAIAANLSVTTDEGNGTLYWVVSQDPSAPDAAAVIAGTGFLASGSRLVTAAGPQGVSVTGLAAGAAYFAHFLHRDGAGNESAVVSSPSFATAASSSADPEIVSAATVLSTSANTGVYTGTPFAFSGAPGGLLVAIVALAQQSAQSLADLVASVDGAPMTLVSGGTHSGGGSRPMIGVFVAQGLGAGNKTITATIAGGARSCTILAAEVVGIDPAVPVANLAVTEGAAQSLSRSYTADRAGNLILSAMATRQGDRGPFTPDQGVTLLQDASTGSTAISDHTVFAGMVVAQTTAASNVGGVPEIDAEALFVVTELQAV